MLTTIFKTWDQHTAAAFPTLAKSIYGGKAMKDFFTLPWLQDMGNENMGNASKKLQSVVDTGRDEGEVVTKFCLAYSNSVLKAETMLKHMVAAAKALEAV
jgi:hypothetical protein